MAAAPFMTTAVTNPRSIRSINTGLSPTLMTWPPSPHRTGFPFFRALRIARTAAVINIHHFVLDGAIWKLLWATWTDRNTSRYDRMNEA